MDGRDPGAKRDVIERAISSDRRAVGLDGNGVLPCGIAIAVDHQPGIGLVNERRIEQARQFPAEAPHADIDRYMPSPVRGGQTQVAQRLRDGCPGMIPDQQERRAPFRVIDGERLRIVRAQ